MIKRRSYQSRVKSRDRQGAEVTAVEREYLPNAIALHGRHDARIVSPKAGHIAAFDQRRPTIAQVIAVWQKREAPAEKNAPTAPPAPASSPNRSARWEAGLAGGSPRRRTRTSFEELRSAALSTCPELPSCFACRGALRVVRPRHPREQVGFEQDHSLSIRE